MREKKRPAIVCSCYVENGAGDPYRKHVTPVVDCPKHTTPVLQELQRRGRECSRPTLNHVRREAW